jgi:serine protease Do
MGRQIMSRRIIIYLGVSALFLFVGAREMRSQEVSPPEPPAPPEAVAPPAELVDPEPEVYVGEMQNLLGDGQSWLGVTLQDVTSDKAKEMKLPGEFGAVVEDVEEGSPAAKAGLVKGEVILEFAGQRVWSVAQLRRMIKETPAGRTVGLQVAHEGKTRTVNVKLEAGRKNTFNFKGPEIHVPHIAIPKFNFQWFMSGATLGISGDDLTRQLAEFFGVKQGKGVLVREVLVGSGAAKAGLKAGDVITKVDGKEVGSVSELREALESKSSEEKPKANLTIIRDRHEQNVTVPLEASSPGERERLARSSNANPNRTEIERIVAAAKLQMAEAQRAAREAQQEWQSHQREWQGALHRQMEEQKVQTQQQLEEKKKQLDEQLKGLRDQLKGQGVI